MTSDQLLLFDHDPANENESDLGDREVNAVLSASDWTVETLLNQLRHERIDLSPRYQRREAWTDSRKSLFIESIILGMPVPQIILAERKSKRGTFLVIDGKQRLLALRRFCAAPAEIESDADFTPFRLKGLELRTDLNGKLFSEMRDDPGFTEDVSNFENQTIRTVVVKNWPSEEYLYRLFLRLNTGSLPLSTQELRQALHPGPFLDFAESYSAESNAFKRLFHLDRPDFRMRDVELLVRFFAFSYFLSQYHGNLKQFLDNTCLRLNETWETDSDRIQDLARRCDAAIETTTEIFGAENAFRRWNSDRYERMINRAVFDVMTYYFKDPRVVERAIELKESVKREFERLCTDDVDFTNSIIFTTKSVSSTYYRLNAWGARLEQVLKIDLMTPGL